MSTSSQPFESINWKLSTSEIAELLETLGISPPRSINDNFLVSSPISQQNLSDFDNCKEWEICENVSDCKTIENEDLDRESIIEELKIVTENGKNIKSKNDYFHDYLVEHFKRKQMMHVCTNDSEDDVLLNEYLRKLDELEKSNEELRGSREKWDSEIIKTRTDIRKRKDDARDAVEKMFEKEREVGTSTWYCGKPLSLKKVQTLIARQLGKIKDIAKFRIRYARLRDEFITIEADLRRSSISSPNLTKEDYERLVAEQFRYKCELRIINEQSDNFTKRRHKIIILLRFIKHQIIEIKYSINNYEKIIINLKNFIKTYLEKRKIWLKKLADAKHFMNDFNEIIGQSERLEFAKTISNLRKEHEEWMKKISSLLKDIKKLGESLNSLRTNLLLREEELEKTEKLISPSEFEGNSEQVLQ